MERQQKHPVRKKFSSNPVVWKMVMIMCVFMMVMLTWSIGSLISGISVAAQ